MSGVTKTSAGRGKSLGFACILKRKLQAEACTTSRFLPSYLHTHTFSLLLSLHTHTVTRGHRWALWMKKRSHLSDSSSLHLAAPFKNTLYSLLTLNLHFTDSMMESPILPPFLPSLSYSLSLSVSLLSLELPLSFHPGCQRSLHKSEG